MGFHLIRNVLFSFLFLMLSLSLPAERLTQKSEEFRFETVEVLPFWFIILIAVITVIAIIITLFMLLLNLKVAQIKSLLEESEAGYKRLFQSAPDLIALIAYSGEKKWNFIDVNKAFCEKTGFIRDEMLSMNVDDYMTAEFRTKLKPFLNILRNNDSFLLDTKFPAKKGGTIPVQISTQIYTSGGEKYLLTIARDLSERQELNSAISTVQQRYTTIADYNYDWEFWLSEEGGFIYNSPSCERISGYRAEEFSENENLLADIIHPDDRHIWADHLCSEQRDSENERELELRLIKKDGSVVWIHHQSRFVFSSDNQNLGIRGNFRDVTERKGMEEQLAQKQRLSSLGILAGGIAHDFNNLLAIIKGFSDIGKNKEGIDEDVSGIFETINQASIRGEHLTEQILDFSRNKVTETRPVQISAIIKEINKLINPSFPSSITIIQNIENNSFIMADAGQVHRAVMNLCTNARLAMPEGGELTISIKELDPVTISEGLSSFRNRRCMELMIKDSGLGMTEEVKNRAFDPYYTTRKTGEGSGMGLAVVHGLVQQWGGQIVIESSPGQGTAIYLYLPILDFDIDVEPEEPSLEIESRPSKVLVIDDEPMILKLIGFYLEKRGYSVGSFSSPSEALEEFRQNPDEYKLAVMDMTMPGIQGDKLADLLKEIKKDLQVILCSGSAEELQKKLKNDSVDRILNKPFTENEILKMIGELL